MSERGEAVRVAVVQPRLPGPREENVAKVETPEDPHSPKIYGLRKVLLEGSELYRIGAADADTLAKNCPPVPRRSRTMKTAI